MSIEFLETAKQMEQEGIEYYRQLAQESQVKAIAGIFEFFMHEEQRHYEIFDALAKNMEIPQIHKENSIAYVKDTFKKLTEASSDLPPLDHDAAYEKALNMEKNAVTFYKEELEKTESDDEKKQLQYIIIQEESHVKLVQALMEFQRHPHEWLENAEWYHLDEF